MMKSEYLKKALRLSAFFFFCFVTIVVSVYIRDYFTRDRSSRMERQVSKAEMSEFFGTEPVLNYSGTELGSSDIDRLRADFKGSDKTVVFHLWASWCEPCITEIPDFLEAVERAQSANAPIVFVAVSLDHDQADLGRFLRNFPKLNEPPVIGIWDDQSRILDFIGIQKLPATVIWGADGQYRRIDGVVDWKRISL